MKAVLILLILSLTLLASTQEFKESYKKYKEKNYAEAFVEFKELALQNRDYDAAYMLGYMYENAEGCKKDAQEAKKWYSISAKGFHKRSKLRVNSDIERNNDRIVDILSSVDNKETQKTIYRTAHSLFNIKAHHDNYILPYSLRVNGNYDCSTHARATNSAEMEFQLSLKYDFLPNLLGMAEIYTVAYTQHSFWQRYTGDAYFRASDYNPEFYVTFPLDTEYLKALQLSIAHTSNGLGIPQERAWNYTTLSALFQYKSLFTELKLWHRLSDNYDYNPELIDSMGHGHLKLLLPYEKHLFTALFRDNFKGKGAIDTRYSYPLFGDNLFLYIKGFAGYGESIGVYAGNPEQIGATHLHDIYVEKMGVGIALSR